MEVIFANDGGNRYWWVIGIVVFLMIGAGDK